MNVTGVDKQSVEEAVQEAEAKPLAFDPAVRATYIRSMLSEIPPLVNRGVPVEDLRRTYSSFAESYPKFFDKIVKKEDLSPIHTMLISLDRMGTGSLTQHTASILVGQKLVDRFVKPQLDGSAEGKRTH